MLVVDDFELNSEQKNAVIKPGNVFLNACPGSGKTRTLTYKIIYELSRLTSNKRYVVAITFTNRAANEIRERVEALGVDISQLWIGTIHSFCLEWIVRPYCIYSPTLSHGYGVLNSHDAEKIIVELCKPYSAEQISHWDCGYIAMPKGYRLTCNDRAKHDLVRKVLKKYFEVLNQSRQIDFEMILHYAYQLIDRNQSIGSLLSKLFEYILVDEYQDTREIQYSILSNIIQAGCGRTKAFVVGDPNQAIYGSLGGYAIPVEDFSKKCCADFSFLNLGKNYRSSSRIVEYCKEYSIFDSSSASFSSHRDYESKISFDCKTHKDNIVHEIIRLIQLSINEYKIEPNEICIIAPRWVQLAKMTRLLISHLPEYDIYGPGMVPFARDIENLFYKLSRIVLTTASPEMYTKRLYWAGEIISDLSDAGINTESLTSRRMLKVSNSIRLDQQEGLEYLESFFVVFFRDLGMDIDQYPFLKEHHSSFFESSQARIDKLRGQGAEFIGNLSAFRKVFRQKSGITISTIHGVKGNEFDTVIAYGLLEGMVPHFSDLDQEESAKKLLYVISSRARKNLHLISETGRMYNKTATPILNKYPFQYDLV